MSEDLPTLGTPMTMMQYSTLCRRKGGLRPAGQEGRPRTEAAHPTCREPRAAGGPPTRPPRPTAAQQLGPAHQPLLGDSGSCSRPVP